MRLLILRFLISVKLIIIFCIKFMYKKFIKKDPQNFEMKYLPKFVLRNNGILSNTKAGNGKTLKIIR